MRLLPRYTRSAVLTYHRMLRSSHYTTNIKVSHISVGRHISPSMLAPLLKVEALHIGL